VGLKSPLPNLIESSIMQLEKPKLFPEKKTFIWVMVALVAVILIRLFFEYQSYQNFISKPFYYTHSKVLSQSIKTKQNKTYKVLKLRSDEGLTFYTSSYKKETFTGKRLRMQIFPSDKITFAGYLGTFYVKSRIKNVEALPFTLKDDLLEKVASQHQEVSLQTFYNAIFFATPLQKELREKISMLGVSHLVALSGFHLGILGIGVRNTVVIVSTFAAKIFPLSSCSF